MLTQEAVALLLALASGCGDVLQRNTPPLLLCAAAAATVAVGGGERSGVRVLRCGGVSAVLSTCHGRVC